MPLVYASEHLSLAMLETLVHTDPDMLPDNLLACEIEVPDGYVRDVDLKDLPADWTHKLQVTRAIGDTWVRERRGLALRVPSVVVPVERNLLLDPSHPRARRLRVVASEPFALDERLRR